VQELTRVLLHLVSRAGMAGMVELDGNPRRRRKGHRRRRGSGGEHRQGTYARELVSHGEGIRATNWRNMCWIKGDRRRPKRRRRGRKPASIGEARWWTRELIDGSGSFTGMM
jgi:hypothetical protein